MSTTLAPTASVNRAEEPATGSGALSAIAVDATDLSVTDLAENIACQREEQRQAIAVAAYYRAQSRGFAPGYELEDWLAAEAEIVGK